MDECLEGTKVKLVWLKDKILELTSTVPPVPRPVTLEKPKETVVDDPLIVIFSIAADGDEEDKKAKIEDCRNVLQAARNLGELCAFHDGKELVIDDDGQKAPDPPEKNDHEYKAEKEEKEVKDEEIKLQCKKLHTINFKTSWTKDDILKFSDDVVKRLSTGTGIACDSLIVIITCHTEGSQEDYNFDNIYDSSGEEDGFVPLEDIYEKFGKRFNKYARKDTFPMLFMVDRYRNVLHRDKAKAYNRVGGHCPPIWTPPGGQFIQFYSHRSAFAIDHSYPDKDPPEPEYIKSIPSGKYGGALTRAFAKWFVKEPKKLSKEHRSREEDREDQWTDDHENLEVDPIPPPICPLKDYLDKMKYEINKFGADAQTDICKVETFHKFSLQIWGHDDDDKKKKKKKKKSSKKKKKGSDDESSDSDDSE